MSDAPFSAWLTRGVAIAISYLICESYAGLAVSRQLSALTFKLTADRSSQVFCDAM